MIKIKSIDHIGIRVADKDRAIEFYNLFDFKLVRAADNDDVIVMKNDHDVEINIIFNANNTNKTRIDVRADKALWNGNINRLKFIGTEKPVRTRIRIY